MTEIRTIPSNGYVVASTFSGCGGTCLGYRMDGYRVAYASEFVEAARESYRANADASTVLDDRDVRDVTGRDIMDACGVDVGELDVLEGSPPCASFSTAGKRERSWGQVKAYSDGVRQRTDDLFFEFARLVGEVQPKVFTAENVSGLVKGVAVGYFKRIIAELKDKGYEVSARLLDASWLGVPQERQRIIIVGVRRDLVERYGVRPAHPEPLPYRYSVRDALPWISAQGDNGPFGAGGMRPAERPSPTIGASPQTGNGRFPASVVEALAEPENAWDAVDPRARTVDPDEPSPTILTHGRGWNQIAVRTGDPHPVGERAGCGSHDGHRVADPDAPSPTVLAQDRGFSDIGVPATRTRIVGGNAAPFDAKGKELSLDRPLPSVLALNEIHNGHQFIVETETAPTPEQAAAYDRTPPGGQFDYSWSKKRTAVDAPSHTVGTCEDIFHPTERRKFTIAELRRICGFPDDFILHGTYGQQWERLGRAVPPVMAYHIARTVRERILDPIREVGG